MSATVSSSNTTGGKVTTPPRPSGNPKKTLPPRISFDFDDVNAPSNPSTIESVLTNESSSYLEVSKVCLQLLSPELSTVSPPGISQLSVEPLASAPHWLGHCLQHHRDRTCRIRVATTLACVARRLYTRQRPSPLLYAQKEPSHWEDEVGSDVATRLVMAALEDADDGVAVACIAALGHLIGTDAATHTGLYEGHQLAQHVWHVQCGTSPYAPTLRSVADEDVGVALQELTVRVLEHAVAPRLLALVERLLRLRSRRHVASALPAITQACLHLLQVYPATLFQTERSLYSKRWSVLDVAGAVDILVTAVLTPMWQPAAAVAALQFAQALPDRPWVPAVTRATVRVFQDTYVPQAPLETNRAQLALLLVALRATPVAERTTTLLWITEQWRSWPSTYAGRRPTRISLWTEVALSFFLDGPVEAPRQRANSLRQFLTPSPRSEELLLAATSVAIAAGRRLWLAADGVTPLAAPDPGEWWSLATVVLESFADCAVRAVGTTFLDEGLSILNAGLASYVQLLQEYLHCVGLLFPSTSVALKLGPNACPPHILWDRLTESAAFLAKLDATILESPVRSEDYVRTTTALLDGLVRREMQTGIPSHPMRLFVLALAADHWVQCRISSLRKHFLEAATGGSSAVPAPEALNVASGREILTAIAPKRLLAKILQSHVPPVSTDGKPRRDPVKKLALESARVSVAAIENMALMVCDWRRRFGSSSESKLLVSIAVGLLQGKMDDTPVDDALQAAMSPLCEAAVSRIQSFYESSGPASPSMDSFPLSELVLQPVKIKIKPLVSSASKPNPRPRSDIQQEYMMQLYRQIVASRIQLSILSCPPAADALFTPARGVHWLRVAVPPVPPSRDGRMYGSRGPAMATWEHSVRTASAPADPIQLIVAYTIRRYLRYDGEDDFRLTVLVRAFNMTPIDIAEGLRLELGITENTDEYYGLSDSATLSQIESLGSKIEDLLSKPPLSSVSVEYRQEIKSGESITWEVTLDDVKASNSLQLVPSVVFLNVPVEPDDSKTNWQGDKASVGEQSDAKSGEDDFRVTSSEVGAKNSFQEGTASVRLIGEALTLPPLIVCQPCPLVFFTDRCGDIDSFRFFWFRFQYHLAPLKLVSLSDRDSVQGGNPITRKIAEMSSLSWDGEAIPGGVATKLWAFMSLSGMRVFCVLTESESPTNASIPQKTLYVRGDDQSLLFSFIGSKESRDSVVSSLVPNMLPDA